MGWCEREATVQSACRSCSPLSLLSFFSWAAFLGNDLHERLGDHLGWRLVRAGPEKGCEQRRLCQGLGSDAFFAGQIVGVRTSDRSLVPGTTTNAPIVSGAYLNKKIYWGQNNGGISVFDTQAHTIKHFIKSVIDMTEVTLLTMNPDGTGLWIALRKATPGMDNWCFQQYFTLVNVTTEPALNPNWEAFSGRHPGPCTGLHVDFLAAQVYYTDSTIRGEGQLDDESGDFFC
jgi:hypothetical protein